MGVVAGAQPDMGRIVLGGILETIGILIVVLPGFLEGEGFRWVMPWTAIGAVFVLLGGAISLKALWDARRTTM